MQSSIIYSAKKIADYKYLRVVARLCLFLGLLLAIWYTLSKQEKNFSQLWVVVRQATDFNSWLGNLSLIWVIALVPLNWFLETLKWSVLFPAEESLGKKFKQILFGVSLGLVIPRVAGDYLSRKSNTLTKPSSTYTTAIAYNRVSQAVVTYCIGLVGFIYIAGQSFSVNFWVILVSSIAALGLFIGIWLNLARIINQLSAWPVLKKFFLGSEEAKAINSSQNAQTILLAAIRYGIFTLQYMLLLNWIGLGLPVLYMAAGVAATFMLKSSLPVLNFISDLGSRELSALFVFGLLEADLSLVIAASLLLWLANILLPALVGAGLWLAKSRNYTTA